MTAECGGFDVLLDRQPQLWLLALATYGIGDFITTAYGLSSRQAAEAGPIAVGLIREYGLLGLFGLKIVTFLAFFALWKAVDTPGRVAVPMALAVAGAGVTAWNLAVLFLW